MQDINLRTHTARFYLFRYCYIIEWIFPGLTLIYTRCKRIMSYRWYIRCKRSKHVEKYRFSKLPLQIAVKPQYVKKPEGLQHRNKEKQLVPICIAEHQNTLEYFSIYQYSNCYANCRIKAMIQMCGCLPFIYDNIAESYNIPVTQSSIRKTDCNIYTLNTNCNIIIRLIFSDVR